jgi:hypothetical protein
VLVHTPPDFDGEEPRNAPAASRGPATARGAASAPISGSGISNSVSPVICVRRTLSGVQGTAASIQEDTKRLAAAYEKYFDHIRFRNGWSAPPFAKNDVKDIFLEAAQIAVRIRKHYLDVKAKGEARLRQLDGEAQTYLHTEEAARLVKSKQHRKFLLELVDATFRDARGYVEGLSRAVVVQLVAEINIYSYNPRVHVLHVVARLEDALKRAPLPAELQLAGSNEQTALADNTAYVADGSAAEQKWRDPIKKLYALVDELEEAMKASTRSQ